jgi:NAD(P)H-dependent FMN reductase
MITVGLIIGSMRENRESIGILNWIIEKLTIHEEVEPKILDLKNYSLPFFGEDTNKDMVKK